VTSTLSGPPQGSGESTLAGSTSTVVNLAKEAEVYAGRDIKGLELLGQNNSSNDVTSIVAGRDITYPTNLLPIGPSVNGVPTFELDQISAIEIGGPGNLVIEAGRNVDLGSSTGIQTFGNMLNPSLKTTAGASITIDTGLGSLLTLPAYNAFTSQYVDPATASANQYAEPLELFDAKGDLIGSGDQAYMYLTRLPQAAQQILLNRIFFGLVRDSGREHTSAAGGGNFELSALPTDDTIDTAGQLNAAFASYQRAYAVIGTFFGGTSSSPYSGGDFLGGLSTVRTLSGGNITVLSPYGQIEVGLVTPPAGFTYSKPSDPLWALGFGIVTEKGGDVDLYAQGNISVNQSRVFTLDGGDITIVSQTGNIDAGKGAKTVQAIQPPSVTYDPYGNITITPYGPASGSGIAVLRALADVPLSNVDLIAFQGIINAGDAGIRVSGNINLAAVAVVNASNITVGGTATGIPVVSAPNIGALTSASSTTGASAKAAEAPTGSTKSNNQPSVIIVEVIGYGGGDDSDSGRPNNEQSRGNRAPRSYNLNSPVQVIGSGDLTATQKQQLTAPEQKIYEDALR
jgi:hypothetical protein